MTTFLLYFGLKLRKLLCSHTDKLSQTLQSDKMAAVRSKRLAILTIEPSTACEVKKILRQCTIYV